MKGIKPSSYLLLVSLGCFPLSLSKTYQWVAHLQITRWHRTWTPGVTNTVIITVIFISFSWNLILLFFMSGYAKRSRSGPSCQLSGQCRAWVAQDRWSLSCITISLCYLPRRCFVCVCTPSSAYLAKKKGQETHFYAYLGELDTRGWLSFSGIWLLVSLRLYWKSQAEQEVEITAKGPNERWSLQHSCPALSFSVLISLLSLSFWHPWMYNPLQHVYVLHGENGSLEKAHKPRTQTPTKRRKKTRTYFNKKGELLMANVCCLFRKCPWEYCW